MGMRDTGRGVGYTKHFDDTLKAGIYRDHVPNVTFLYETSLTQSTEYALGDRVVLPDGREFRYAKSGSACSNAYGVHFTDSGHQAYTTMTTTVAIGDRSITVPAGTHDALDKDELRGGYLLMFQGGADLYTTVRGITGNDASAQDVAYTLYLDADLTYAYTSGTAAVEIYANPYASLRSGGTFQAFVGVPASYVSATATYFWVQTKGVCWPVPGPALGVEEGTANGQFSGYWAANGIVVRGDQALAGITVPVATSDQWAGFVIAGDQENNGPLFHLGSL